MSGLVRTASRATSLAPASPPSASAMCRCRSRYLAVRRLERAITPARRSANVWLEQNPLGQRNRRAATRIVTGRPCHGRSVKPALIDAVNPGRRNTATRTVCHDRAGCRLDGDLLRTRQHAGYLERTEDEGQQGRGHEQNTMDVSSISLPNPTTRYKPSSTQIAGEPEIHCHSQKMR